jgi:hypothetical protein
MSAARKGSRSGASLRVVVTKEHPRALTAARGDRARLHHAHLGAEVARLDGEGLGERLQRPLAGPAGRSGARATVARLRAYVQDGQPLLTAVAEPDAGGFSAWYADLNPDGVARQLERHRAYPIDLDATCDERGVRYTVVMRR